MIFCLYQLVALFRSHRYFRSCVRVFLVDDSSTIDRGFYFHIQTEYDKGSFYVLMQVSPGYVMLCYVMLCYMFVYCYILDYVGFLVPHCTLYYGLLCMSV
jgi:hypothetical protein